MAPPPEATSPLCEVHGQGDVGCQGDEQDGGYPGLQCGGQVGACCHNVEQLRACTLPQGAEELRVIFIMGN